MEEENKTPPLVERENISYMKAPITNKTPSYTVSLNQIHTAITDPDIYRDRTIEYRESLEKGNIKKAKHIKNNDFDYVTFSGKFKYVSNNSLIIHSGLIAIDIDDLNEMEGKTGAEEIKKVLLNDDVIDTAMLFISPSGNGLKWIINIDIDHNNPHLSNKNYFRAIDEYLKQSYNIEIDKACKDVARACYLPYDPDCFLNEKAQKLGKDFLDLWKPEEKAPNIFKKKKSEVAGEEKTPWEDYNENADIGKLLLKHGWSYVKSDETGDKYLRPGNSSSKYSAIKFRDSNVLYVHSNNSKLSTGNHTPAKVFCTLETDGDWSKAAKLLREKGYGDQKRLNISNSLDRKEEKESIPSAEVYQFWNISENGLCTIHYASYVQFLEEELNYYQVNTFGITHIVKIDGHVMHKSDSDDIIQETRRYIENNLDSPLDVKVAEAFIKIIGKINRAELTAYLERVDFNEQEETHENAYFYYKDKMVEVKKDDIIVKDYKDLDGYIWADQRLQREWQGTCDFKNFNYFKFLQNITHHNKDRWDLMRTVLGYLLHSNKTEGNAKAIIFVDEFTYGEEINVSDGGTGKSIVGKSLQHMKKQCYIDGKRFKPGESKFALSQVEPGDQTVFIDDIKKGFNFEDIYVMVTSDLEIERKFKDKMKIPFAKAPKIVIASNKSLKGDGGESDSRRQITVEFHKHYNAKFTPKDEFNGEVFFDKYMWNLEDWKKFDSLMVHCLQYYFSQSNKIKQVEGSYQERKLIESIGPEIYEFCEESIKPNIKYTTEDLYNGDITSTSGKMKLGFINQYDYEISKRGLIVRVKKWAKYKGWNPVHTRDGAKRAWMFKKEP